MWNDVTALSHASQSLEVAGELARGLGFQVVLMHMKGEPRTMQDAPTYQDVVQEVEAYLLNRARAAEAVGLTRDQIWLDPGIGFGKTLAHNLALLRATARLAGHGYRVLIAASRKRFILGIDDQATAATDRLGGSLATHLYAAQAGAAMVRVHDVRETVQALRVMAAILTA